MPAFRISKPSAVAYCFGVSVGAGAGVAGAEPVVMPGCAFGRGVTSRTAGGAGAAGFCATLLDGVVDAVSLVAVDMP
jgi:hypothetical protein